MEESTLRWPTDKEREEMEEVSLKKIVSKRLYAYRQSYVLFLTRLIVPFFDVLVNLKSLLCTHKIF